MRSGPGVGVDGGPGSGEGEIVVESCAVGLASFDSGFVSCAAFGGACEGWVSELGFEELVDDDVLDEGLMDMTAGAADARSGGPSCIASGSDFASVAASFSCVGLALLSFADLSFFCRPFDLAPFCDSAAFLSFPAAGGFRSSGNGSFAVPYRWG